MAYQHVVTLDREGEDFNVNGDTVLFCNTSGLEDHIKHLSRKNPLYTICVYNISQMQKLKGKPSYSRYRVTEKGEVIPE